MKKKHLFFAGILTIIILFIFGLFPALYFKNSQVDPIKSVFQKEPNIHVSPTPFPFAEITIPYLRNRTYQSSLSRLNHAVETSSYIGYVTGYDSDGLNINGYLTIPKGPAPQNGWPAIVFVHGYIVPQNYQTLVNYSAFVDFLAKNKLVVFKIDLRGHGQSDGDPGGAYYSSDYIIDTLHARAALQKSGFVNPTAVGLWGHSMAGNVVARALAAAPEIPAIVIWAGAVYTYADFSMYSIEDNSYQPPPADSPSRKKRNELFASYGQFDPKSDFWKQVPMTNYLDGIQGAIQINHTLDDPVVDIRYSRNLNSLLDNSLILHELNEYASGGHNFTGSTFNSAMQKTIAFFAKYLK